MPSPPWIERDAVPGPEPRSAVTGRACPAELLVECARLLRPRGVMAVATINRTVRSWLMAIVGAEYLLRWLPRGTHRWRRFVTPEEVAGALAAGGLEVLARTGVRVNPLTRGFGLTRSLAVNYMMLARSTRVRSSPAQAAFDATAGAR